MAFMLGRQQLFLEIEEEHNDEMMDDGGEGGGAVINGLILPVNLDVMDLSGIEDAEDLTEIMSNVHLNNNFLALAREVMS